MIRCPECARGLSLYVRDVFEWEPVRGWRKLFGWGARRIKTGECAVCMHCNTPFIVTPSGAIERPREMPRPRPGQAHPNGQSRGANDALADFERSLAVGAEEP